MDSQNSPSLSQNDSNIPAPRTSAAIFGTSDRLLTFHSLRYRTSSVANYKDFKNFRTGKLPSTTEQFSISNYFYANTTSHPRHSESAFYESSGTLIDPHLKILDCSSLTFLNSTLSSKYILCGDSQDVCAHNAQAAQSEGRKDLVQLWNLLKIILDDRVYKVVDEKIYYFGIPWECHPLGKPILTKMYSTLYFPHLLTFLLLDSTII